MARGSVRDDRALGISAEGVKVALEIKEGYRNRELIAVPGGDGRLLVPEHLLNHELDLRAMEDPLPLAMMATRDPESPMALAAVTRLLHWRGRRNWSPEFLTSSPRNPNMFWCGVASN